MGYNGAMAESGRTILLVDDDTNILDVLEYTLTHEGYGACRVQTAGEALKTFQSGGVDLIILDLGLPDMDGIDLCRHIREKDPVPIIILTCRDDEIDRVVGLEVGADDYITKPFSKRELLARVKVLFRRLDLDRQAGTADPETVMSVGPLSVDSQTCRAYLNGVDLKLTVSECIILTELVRSPRSVLSRERLLNALDPDNLEVSDRSIDSYIKRIRSKIRRIDPGAEWIETVYGLGYRLRTEKNAG